MKQNIENRLSLLIFERVHLTTSENVYQHLIHPLEAQQQVYIFLFHALGLNTYTVVLFLEKIKHGDIYTTDNKRWMVLFFMPREKIHVHDYCDGDQLVAVSKWMPAANMLTVKSH
uniref:Uncharacterized protein n=1 Tax=Nelumbo nucifera TaxID=4432 RepID=A0A822ZWG9_NELNU|nr:TPA_asm: hypothetical protein HUJ06_004498 [Nelumbo nucifera]